MLFVIPSNVWLLLDYRTLVSMLFFLAGDGWKVGFRRALGSEDLNEWESMMEETIDDISLFQLYSG